MINTGELTKDAAQNAETIRKKYPVKKPKKKSTAATKTTSKSPRKDPVLVSEAVNSVFFWKGRPIVQSDVEVADRLNEFFQTCQDRGEIPTIEKLALALGTYSAKLGKWENGDQLAPLMTDASVEMIRKAKSMVAAIDAELVMMGKIPAVPYVFRSKNFYGMKDKVETVVTSTDQVQSPEQLANKYKDVVEVVDVVYNKKKE